MSRKGKPRDLAEIIEQEEKLKLEKALSLKSAFNSTDINQVYKAKRYLESIEKKDDFGGKSMLVDPQSQYIQAGYKDKPLTLSFQVLRGMANTDIIKAIKNYPQIPNK